jgi:hypothetical protein
VLSFILTFVTRIVITTTLPCVITVNLSASDKIKIGDRQLAAALRQLLQFTHLRRLLATNGSNRRCQTSLVEVSRPQLRYIRQRHFWRCCWRRFFGTAMLLLTLHPVSLVAEESGSSRAATTPISGPSGYEWFRPPPPEPDPKFAVLPWSAGRMLVPVPPRARNIAISRLATVESVELTRADCEMLGIPSDANPSLDQTIKEEARSVQSSLRYMRLHPPKGSPSDAAYRTAERGVAEHKAQLAHWESLKGRVRPYLVRAVAANYANQKNQVSFATFWRDSVTVDHHAVIQQSANAPLSQYAPMGDVAPENMVKWPVVVYLEGPPAHVYTQISILKLGR